jgi:hypothetical protein
MRSRIGIGGIMAFVACVIVFAGQESRAERPLPSVLPGSAEPLASCNSDSDCQGHGKCSSGSCNHCGSDSECKTGQCKNGMCGSCNSDSQCNGNGKCSNGQCGSCGSDSECPSHTCSGGRCKDYYP